jgi:hypothetical protein
MRIKGDTELKRHLRELEACEAGIACVGTKTPEEAWNTATHPGMLIWWALQTKVNEFEKVHAIEVQLGIPHASVVDSAACDVIREHLKCPFPR